MKDDVVRASFRVTLPAGKWMSLFSRKYPRLTFNLLSMVIHADGTGDTQVQVIGSDLPEFVEEYTSDRGMKPNSTILHSGPDHLLMNVKSTEPRILGAAVKAKILLQYPVEVGEGLATMTVIAKRSRVDKFIENLGEHEITTTFQSIGRYQAPAVLTPHQEAILHAALESGYFDIPRRITLTALASGVNLSPSTVSEILRRIFKKLGRNNMRARRT